VVGGFVYGLIFSFIGVLLPQTLLDYREAFMFLIVILILLWRPEGLGGRNMSRSALDETINICNPSV